MNNGTRRQTGLDQSSLGQQGMGTRTGGDHHLINRKNTLREKVGGHEVGGGHISEAAIMRAEAAVEQHKEKDLEQAGKDRDQLRQLYQELRASRSKPEPAIQALSQIGREIKGQAETFGYALLGRFGDSLYQFTRQMVTVNDRQLDLIKAHIDAIDVVVSQNVAGTGGQLGEELSNSLRRAIQRVAVS